MKYKLSYIPLGMKIFANFVSFFCFPFDSFWVLLCLGSLIIILAARQDHFSLEFHLLFIFMSSFLFKFFVCLFVSLCSPAVWFFYLDGIDKDGDFNCICRNKVGSLEWVTCLTNFSFENVHILHLSTSNGSVKINS